MNKTLTAAMVVVIGLFVAPVAHADDFMYRVPTDMAPGQYQYRVVGSDWGAWHTCATTTCQVGDGLIDMDMINGAGHTGWMTVPSSARFVKITNLYLVPA